MLVTFMIADLQIKDSGCPESMSWLLGMISAAFFVLPKWLGDELTGLAMGLASIMVKKMPSAAAPACKAL